MISDSKEDRYFHLQVQALEFKRAKEAKEQHVLNATRLLSLGLKHGRILTQPFPLHQPLRVINNHKPTSTSKPNRKDSMLSKVPGVAIRRDSFKALLGLYSMNSIVAKPQTEVERWEDPAHM
jgi:hypothetical protein